MKGNKLETQSLSNLSESERVQSEQVQSGLSAKYYNMYWVLAGLYFSAAIIAPYIENNAL